MFVDGFLARSWDSLLCSIENVFGVVSVCLGLRKGWLDGGVFGNECDIDPDSSEERERV